MAQTYRPNRKGIVTDAPDSKKANQRADAENIRRAIARWMRGKGGVNTQRRLQKSGFNLANVNPGQMPKRTPKSKRPPRMY